MRTDPRPIPDSRVPCLSTGDAVVVLRRVGIPAAAAGPRGRGGSCPVVTPPEHVGREHGPTARATDELGAGPERKHGNEVQGEDLPHPDLVVPGFPPTRRAVERTGSHRPLHRFGAEDDDPEHAPYDREPVPLCSLSHPELGGPVVAVGARSDRPLRGALVRPRGRAAVFCRSRRSRRRR